MANLVERIKQLREQSKLSQQELADKLNVTKQAISQYERGIRKPDYETILSLCDLFNVSSDYLLGKTNMTLRMVTEEDLEKLSCQLTPSEQTLLTGFRKLNTTGQEKAIDYVEDLTENEKYTKDTELLLAEGM